MVKKQNHILMKYYSTNKQASDATLEEAVVRGLAGDKGLDRKPFVSGDSLLRGGCFLRRRCARRCVETNRVRHLEF